MVCFHSVSSSELSHDRPPAQQPRECLQRRKPAPRIASLGLRRAEVHCRQPAAAHTLNSIPTDNETNLPSPHHALALWHQLAKEAAEADPKFYLQLQPTVFKNSKLTLDVILIKQRSHTLDSKRSTDRCCNAKLQTLIQSISKSSCILSKLSKKTPHPTETASTSSSIVILYPGPLALHLCLAPRGLHPDPPAPWAHPVLLRRRLLPPPRPLPLGPSLSICATVAL